MKPFIRTDRSNCVTRRKGFTLIELLIVIAIIALLIALLVPAVQKVRDSGNRVKCQNNLRQLAIAVHHFQGANKTMPTYFGIYPPIRNQVTPGTNRNAVYGSWFVHLLPYVEEDNTSRLITDDIMTAGYNERRTLTPPSGLQTTTTTVNNNGHIYTYSTSFYTTPGTYEDHGIWLPEVRNKRFSVLICPSDPSIGTNPQAHVGLAYATSNPGWGSTNFLANWHAWGNGQSGLWTPPQPLIAITDGMSNTILFGEGYSWCDDRGRIALYSWSYHNFGLTTALGNAQLPPGSPPINFPNGMPNTLMFQVRPLPVPYARCNGRECCDNWRAQTAHSAMNVALCDGSVRVVAPSISQETWDNALQPRDGIPLGSDW